MGRSRLSVPTAIGWFLVLIATPGLVAADSYRMRLEDTSRGDLATRARPAAVWRLVSQGEEFADGEVRTSSAGPCRLKLPGAVLHIGPDSRATLSTSGRLISLSEGQLYLDATEAWEAVAGNRKVSIAPKTAIELQVRPNGDVTVRQLANSAAVRTEGVMKTDSPKNSSGSIAVIQHPPKWISASSSQQGLGELMVKDPRSPSPVRLDIAHYHVNVVLQPPVALVQIDQSFYNDYPTQQEGTFHFQLPHGASVSRFAMYTTPTTLVEGELINQGRAAQIYDLIVSHHPSGSPTPLRTTRPQTPSKVIPPHDKTARN